MKELFIAILAMYNVQALPDIVSTEPWESPEAQQCMSDLRGEAFSVQICSSKLQPEQTFHIYEQHHAYIGTDGWTAWHNYESVNLFIENGVVFEIPMEELFDFYSIKIETK